MPVAAIYDIHGFLPALEAVLQEIRQARVDRIVVGGDVVAGPMPCETLQCLLALEIPVHFVQGNWDIWVHNPEMAPENHREAARWAAKELGPELIGLLATWPKHVTFDVGGLGQVLFCHATPRSPTEYFTCKTEEDRLLPIFSKPKVPVVICGHTHMQFDRMIGTTRVLNAGSVGVPFRDPDEEHGADWLLLGPEAKLRRTRYDADAAKQILSKSSWPHLARDLQPPTAKEMVEKFNKVELDLK